VLLTDGDNVMGETSNPNDSTYSGYGYIWQKRPEERLERGPRRGLHRRRSPRRHGQPPDQDLRQRPSQGRDHLRIGVGVSSHSKAVLQGCASTLDKYYDVTDSAQLAAVFDAIAGSIQNLRIAK
jgi:hypothetical protein